MTNLLVEGGGRVLGSFLEAGQVDEVEAYIAPDPRRRRSSVHAQPGAGECSAWATPPDSKTWRTARSMETCESEESLPSRGGRF